MSLASILMHPIKWIGYTLTGIHFQSAFGLSVITAIGTGLMFGPLANLATIVYPKDGIITLVPTLIIWLLPTLAMLTFCIVSLKQLVTDALVLTSRRIYAQIDRFQTEEKQKLRREYIRKKY